MKFEQIFSQPGWYVAESFTDGVFIEITKTSFDNELKFKCINDANDLFPKQFDTKIYRGLFDKKFVKVLNRNQLFGETRTNLFK